jgi:hypothetical protein
MSKCLPNSRDHEQHEGGRGDEPCDVAGLRAQRVSARFKCGRLRVSHYGTPTALRPWGMQGAANMVCRWSKNETSEGRQEGEETNGPGTRG